jgi:hypothetical protein
MSLKSEEILPVPEEIAYDSGKHSLTDRYTEL